MTLYLLDTNHASRRMGGDRVIRPMDAQIAAVARIQGATVLTADRQMAMIPELRVENWLAAA